MPTPSTAKWPVPKSEDEFEDMVVDALSLRWDDRTVTRHGRRGQRQHGVDVYGQEAPDGGGRLVAQCKNSEKYSLDLLEAELAKTTGFFSPIREFLLVLSAPRDAAFQKEVSNVSKQRVGRNEFPVDVLFYDDVTSEIAKDPALVEKHFPWPQGTVQGPRAMSWIDFVINPTIQHLRAQELSLLGKSLWTWRYETQAFEYIGRLCDDISPILTDFRDENFPEYQLLTFWDQGMADLAAAALAEHQHLVGASKRFQEAVQQLRDDYAERNPGTHSWSDMVKEGRFLPAVAQQVVNNVVALGSEWHVAGFWNEVREALLDRLKEDDEWRRLDGETHGAGARLMQQGEHLVRSLEGLRRCLCKRHGIPAASGGLLPQPSPWGAGERF